MQIYSVNLNLMGHGPWLHMNLENSMAHRRPGAGDQHHRPGFRNQIALLPDAWAYLGPKAAL